MKLHYFLVLSFAILIMSCTDDEVIVPEINSQIIDDPIPVITTKEDQAKNNDKNYSKGEKETSDFLLEKIHFKSTYFEIDQPS